MFRKTDGGQHELLTPHQVAELLRVSPVTVRHWALDGKLEFVTTPGGHRRFSYDHIEQFARQRGVVLSTSDKESRRVLIVDDNSELANYLVELLSDLDKGVVTDVAHDGFGAGEKLHVFKPHIVLLDLMMPGLNGFETCRRVKQNETTKHMRVIAMSGYPSQGNVQKIIAAGAELCLAKPILASALFQVLGVNDMGDASEPGAQKTGAAIQQRRIN